MNISSTSSSSSTDYGRITGLATGLDTDNMIKQMLSGEQTKIDTAKQDLQYLTWQQEAYVDIIKDIKNFSSTYLDLTAPSSTNMALSGAYVGLKAVSDNDSKFTTSTSSNSAIKGEYEVIIKQVATGDSVKQSLDSNFITTLRNNNDKTLTFNVDGKSFSVKIKINDTDTDEDIKNNFISSLKSASNSDGEYLSNYVNIGYSSISGKLSLETKSTGGNSSLTISGDASLGLTVTEGQKSIISVKVPGEATFSADIEKDTNSFAIDGITFNLKSVSDTDANGDYISNKFTVSADATAQVEKFKKFVEAYNTLIEKINTKISEKKNYNYKPLTEAQKEEMSDDEIEKWEEKAKQGILRRDSSLTNMLQQLRSAVYETVEGAGISITQIGITTSSDYKSGGKLVIDEDKLKKALEENGDLAQKLFTQKGTTNKSKGILQKFDSIIDSYVGSEGLLIQKAGYENTRWVSENTLSKNIQKKNTLISELLEKYYDKQERYYSLFATLEKNMNSLNTQSSWLASQFS